MDTNSQGQARAKEVPGLSPDQFVSGPLPVWWMISVILVVILAGLLFGFDQGVISGALLGIQKEFTLGALALETVTSWVTLGALFGSLLGGSVADRFGRKWALILAAILFVVGALVEAFTPGVPILVVGRLFVGLGVGVAAVAAPLYAAELAPANQRGRFISSYQLAITIGIFVAYFVDEALAGAQGWRWMLGLSVVPGVLLFLAVLPAAESPRWLVKVGRLKDARRTLSMLRPGIDVDVRLKSIEASLQTQSSPVPGASSSPPTGEGLSRSASAWRFFSRLPASMRSSIIPTVFSPQPALPLPPRGPPPLPGRSVASTSWPPSSLSRSSTGLDGGPCFWRASLAWGSASRRSASPSCRRGKQRARPLASSP